MKKRSLVAALAMLMVSAIVLTSSTYAWFATGSQAEVSTIHASLTANDGTITLSGDNGATWTTVLSTFSHPKNVFDPNQTTALTPVSFDPATINFTDFSETIYTGTLKQPEDGGDPEMTPATTSSGYVKVVVLLKASQDQKVTITPDFAAGLNYLHAAVATTTYDSTYTTPSNISNVYYGNSAAAEPYYAIAGETKGVDANNNSIFDAGEGATLTSDTIIPVANQTAMEVYLKGGVAVPVVLYIWAEGQGETCFGSVNLAATSLGITVTKVA